MILTTNGSIAFDANELANDVTLTATSTNNTISTTNAIGLRIVGMDIGAAGVNFAKVDASGGANGIVLENNTGGPITVGTVGDDPPEGGTIANTTAHAVMIVDSANVTLSGLRINTTAGQSGTRIEKNNASLMTLNLNDLAINNGNIGVDVLGGGTGNLIMTVNDTDINGPTTLGVNFNNVDAGTIQANNLVVDGNNITGTGVRILNSNASFTFNDQTVIREVVGTDFEVDGGTGIVNMNGDITNTAGFAVRIHNVTGGAVTFGATSSITDTGGLGIQVDTNTGGTFTFLGENNLSTAGNDAVTITNNTGASISLSDLNITTTAGDGFTATGGGTLTVLGTTNTINTVDGVGLRIEDMTIGAAGVAFQTVDVTSGNTNGIILDNLTGGQVSIGNVGGADGDGGELTTQDTAILLTNVQNVDLRNIRINNVTDAGEDGVVVTHDNTATAAMDVTINNLDVVMADDEGLVVSANDDSNFTLRLTNSTVNNNVEADGTGAGDFAMLVENTTITTGIGTDIGLEIDFSGSLDNADVIIRNVNVTANNASALDINSSGGAAKIFDLLIDQASTFTNDSASITANMVATGGTTLNVSIFDNTFTNNQAAGEVFDLEGNGAGSDVRLDLAGNTAAGGMDFVLESLGGTTFEVFDLTNTFNNSRNTGPVTPLPNAAAFVNRPNPVPLPTIPP